MCNSSFTIADNVSNLDKRRRPNAQACLEYGRESGYAGPLPKWPVKPFLIRCKLKFASVLSACSVAKYSSYAAADKRTAKNKISIVLELLCKTNPIYASFRPKTAIMRKNKPNQTHF